jgi:hypothetical protein
MTYAFVQDVAASWHHYEALDAALTEPGPPGLILHVAGPTEDGIRIIAVWETEKAWDEFRAGPIGSALAALSQCGRPVPTVRELRPRHVVVGRRGNWRFSEEEETA